MVRLRSDRWFSADGQGRSRSAVSSQVAGTRRLVSLCFLLALVVVLMQKAADPKHVRNAFQALGVPLDGSPSLPSPPPNPDLSSGPQLAAANIDPRWAATCDDLVPRLLADASPPQIIGLSQSWFAINSHHAEASGATQVLKQESLAALTRLNQSMDHPPSETQIPEVISWATQLERFHSEWLECWQRFEQNSTDLQSSPVGTSQSKGISQELERAVTTFLDDRLVHSVRDAAPWSKSETVAFGRLLQRGQGRGYANAADLDANPAPWISTLQLESESAVFKGKSIRFRGELRRMQLVQKRQETPDPIEDYWLMWMRGEDGAAQPVAIYGRPENAQTLSQILDPELGIYPALEVTGISAKRLAYASESGVQVAPTLFARSVRVLDVEALAIQSLPPQRLVKELGFALLLGTLIAGFLLVSVVTNWRRSPRTPRPAFHKRKPPNTTAFVWLASACLGLPATQAQDTTPPWAAMDAKQQMWQAAFQERIQAALPMSESESLLAYLHEDSEPLPDALLKLLRLLEQLDWGKNIDPVAGVKLPNQPLHIEPITLAGIVHSAMPVSLSNEQQAWFQRREGERVFRLAIEPKANLFEDSELQSSDLELQSQTGFTSVFCLEVPNAWMQSAQLRQPVQIHGFALVPNAGQVPICVFCPRPNWIVPASGDFAFAPKIVPHQLALARLGWDLAWVDRLAANSQKPLQETEADAFYSLLKTLDAPQRVRASSFLKLEPQSPVRVMANPIAAIGQHVNWRVRLVTGSVVPVASPHARQQLGADQYFQFDGLVDIGDQRIRYPVTGREGAENIYFDREFPVTIVMKATSDFVPKSALTKGELTWPVGRYVKVSGCFYRLWSFQSELMQRKSESARQVAPLVVAISLEPASPPQTSTARDIGWFGYAMCAAILAILSAILFLTLKKEPRRRRYTPRS